MRERLGLVLRLLKEMGRIESQREFAERVGMRATALTEVLAGRTASLPNQVLVLMRNDFGVNLNWLIAADGEPFDRSEAVSDRDREAFRVMAMYPDVAEALFDIPEAKTKDVIRILRSLGKE